MRSRGGSRISIRCGCAFCRRRPDRRGPPSDGSSVPAARTVASSCWPAERASGGAPRRFPSFEGPSQLPNSRAAPISAGTTPRRPRAAAAAGPPRRRSSKSPSRARTSVPAIRPPRGAALVLQARVPPTLPRAQVVHGAPHRPRTRGDARLPHVARLLQAAERAQPRALDGLGFLRLEQPLPRLERARIAMSARETLVIPNGRDDSTPPMPPEKSREIATSPIASAAMRSSCARGALRRALPLEDAAAV